MKRAVHHTKRLYHMTPKFVHGMVTGAFVGIVAVMSLGMYRQANALSIVSARDCDSNAVINCGALTTAELQNRYGNKGVAAIFAHFGISAQDISRVHKTAQAGRVYKDGRITVGGKTVATRAITAGRENISGSTKVTSGGVTFYKRAPSVSFRPDSLAAFVIMENGKFQFAILGACGNPVSGAAVPPPAKPAAAPKPVPEAPEVEEVPDVPAPAVATPSTQTPPSTPTPPVVAAAVTELPKTGPESAVVIGLLSIVGGYIFHTTHRRVKHRRQAARR